MNKYEKVEQLKLICKEIQDILKNQNNGTVISYHISTNDFYIKIFIKEHKKKDSQTLYTTSAYIGGKSKTSINSIDTAILELEEQLKNIKNNGT